MSNICRHYKNKGYCERGDNCSFKHIYDGTKSLCRFIKINDCYQGENCIYSHDLSDPNIQDDESLRMRQNKGERRNTPFPYNNQRKTSRSLSPRSRSRSPYPNSRGDSNSESMSPASKNSSRYNEKISMQSPPFPNTVKKKEICRDFQFNNCKRGDNCTFIHTNKKFCINIILNGFCEKGTACTFSHEEDYGFRFYDSPNAHKNDSFSNNNSRSRSPIPRSRSRSNSPRMSSKSSQYNSPQTKSRNPNVFNDKDHNQKCFFGKSCEKVNCVFNHNGDVPSPQLTGNTFYPSNVYSNQLNSDNLIASAAFNINQNLEFEEARALIKDINMIRKKKIDIENMKNTQLQKTIGQDEANQLNIKLNFYNQDYNKSLTMILEKFLKFLEKKFELENLNIKKELLEMEIKLHSNLKENLNLKNFLNKQRTFLTELQKFEVNNATSNLVEALENKDQAVNFNAVDYSGRLTEVEKLMDIFVGISNRVTELENKVAV
ncbi:hypothetical protein HK099_001487 [Clydaea vesicula]|uniref:C3H1-type domain-containing protein n=1 Tax=Clydaea vesicula TaxID=447962 RepID=A0AAD5U3Q3_9FUNG|nr:hypothetical protein HK099_001487 [Clydaea vesicula]